MWIVCVIQPGEHGGLPDVVEAQVEHANPLHTNSTPSVRRATVSDRVSIQVIPRGFLKFLKKGNFRVQETQKPHLKESM